MTFCKRSLLALLLLCVGCSAQSNTPNDVERRIERQLRAVYQVPDQVDIKLGARTASEFPDYDKVKVILSVGGKQQEQEFLLSRDNKTLVRFSKMDLTKDPYEEVMKKIDISNRPWRGNKDAKVVIVSYDDFQCPYCTHMHRALFDLMKDYGDRVKLVYKDFPLYQIHPWANRASVNGNCLATLSNDAYWGYTDYVHNNPAEISGAENQKSVPEMLDALDKIARDQGLKFKVDMTKLSACLKAQDDAAVRASVKEAQEVGVQATPTIFINGMKIDGAVPPAELRAAIDRALRDAGSAPVSAASSK